MPDQHEARLSVQEMSRLDGLRSWLDACPTPFHVVEMASSVLEAAGFERCRGFGGDLPERGVFVRDGALLAWDRGGITNGLRIVGAHSDSPNLRLQPNPDLGSHGWRQLGVEIYGGVLLNSWLDRDLGVAGRVIGPGGDVHLFNVRGPVARIPQLAIHLDRGVNDSGLTLDKQHHMVPVWGTSDADFRDWLRIQTSLEQIVSFDAHLYDVAPAAIIGHDDSLLASGRLDNQVSCWAAVCGLATTPVSETGRIIVINDHEEVGSDSATGAGGPLLEALVHTLLETDHRRVGDRHDVLARSWCLSADNAHAVHPNYPERHEPRHAPRPNAGPALKVNGNQRYATSSRGIAHARSIAARNSVPLQTFVTRNTMPCGSTIGPITATRLGIETIDVGVPQLSMHSARELCGSLDPGHLLDFVRAFLAE